MRNGSIPILYRRLTALGASFVCSVENVRCPVFASLIAISAVALSRISPTRTMSGSWRRIPRIARSKFIFGPILSCRAPLIMYSTGSSTVSTFSVGSMTWCRAATSVVLLPLPVGPVRMTIPCGLLMALSKNVLAGPMSPSLLRSVMTFLSSRTRMTMLSNLCRYSTPTIGIMETRKRIIVSSIRRWMNPSCDISRSKRSTFLDRSFTTAATASGIVLSCTCHSLSEPSTRNQNSVRFPSFARI